MKDRPKRTIAIISSALALGGTGTGLALAAADSPSTTPSATPSVTLPAPTADVPTPGDTADTSNKDVLTPGDKADTSNKDVATPGDKTDTGTDRETADKAGQEGVENPSAEAAGAREPGEGTAADTGHADPPGQQIDHQDEGTQ